MITRIVKMTFDPAQVPAFQDNFERHKNEIRSFEGCEKLLLLQDLNDQRVFFTYSWWQSEKHLNQYRQSELFTEVWAFTKSLFADKPQAWSVKVKDQL